MNRSVLLIALGLFFAFPRAITAAVFERDWKTPGDGLLTYDDVNQREWLDLSQSRLMSFSGTSAEERYQSVISELFVGGALSGFLVAQSSDVRSLAQSAGIDAATDDISNETATRRLIALIGPTAMTVNGGVSAKGFLDELELQPPVSRRLFGGIHVIPANGPNGTAGLRFTTGVEPFEVPGLGVWLYRNAVPEPSAGTLALLSWALLICRRRRAVQVSGG